MRACILDGTPVPNSNTGQGLDVFKSDYPDSKRIDCDNQASVDGVERTVTAGRSTLTYDRTADQYVYVWKTDKAWKDSCRKLKTVVAS